MSGSEGIKVLNEKCVGCALCVKACPFGAITMKDNKAVIDLSKCNLCGACAGDCKFEAIVIRKKEPKETVDFSLYKDVWVFCEQKKGEVQSISFELLGKGRAFSAIFAANDQMAFGARLALYRRGIRVPEDVSLVGFDDEASAAFMIPPLTTIRQPALEMGQAAAKAILDLIAGKSIEKKVFEAELIIRESVARNR